MARMIGNLVLIVLAVVVIAVVAVVALSLFGVVIGLVGAALKIGLVVAVVYFIALFFKRLTREA